MYNNRKKILLILLILTLLFSLFTVYIYSAGGLSLSARAAVLYEPSCQAVIYSKNADKRMAMASTTKIMSAIVALENSSPDELVAVDERAIGIEGSSIYIERGEQFLMLDLIYAMMLQSANDAAAAIAYHISGGILEFADLMNEKARELGFVNTNFQNPHGLDDKNHYTTAYELAKIASYALENDTFRSISSTYKKEIKSSLKTRTVVNHNKLLNMYDGAIGVKTGYTKKSGRSLVGAAEKDGIRLISVTINAPDDWNDHKKLFDYGYDVLAWSTIANSGDFSFKLPVLSSEKKYINVKNTESASCILPNYDKSVEKRIILPQYAVAPIKCGDKLGDVIFLKNGIEIGRVALFAAEDAEPRRSKFPFL